MTPGERVLAAIAADHAHADPALWIHRVPDADLLARAAAMEHEGQQGRALWGMPVAVKDNIDVAGMPTTAGCPDYAYVPEASAPAVQRLLDAGAIVMGKTNLDQFATGLVGVRSPYGVPRNVFDPARVPGGSSSGSAVAVAAGIVPFSLGTDTAGSGRVPAAFGNIVGLKPTIGAISSRGMVPACRSIDTISVFAHTVDEALAVTRIMAGYDAADPYSRQPPPGAMRRGAEPPVLRMAMPDDLSACDAAVGSLVRQACARVAARPVSIAPFLELAALLYAGPWVAERTSALRTMLDRPGSLHPTTRAILESGLARRTVDAFDAFHLQAQVRRHAAVLFAEFDALILPTAPCCPRLADLVADPIGPNSRLGTYTNFVNLCDLAAIAVPAGLGPNGPAGITLVGPAWSEGRLAMIADRLHRAAVATVGATGEALPPSEPVPDVHSDETRLFCIGAHMSGLPLNGQLTGLGGRFVATAATAPAYRLYALGNRPGLVRGGNGLIIGEVWALPTSAIGALLAQVPPPLGFGMIVLRDGPCLGFLAESAGVLDAVDITQFGGWRRFLEDKHPQRPDSAK